MPSMQEMLRRVARDPVSQALFFDLMVKLFLQHVLGVDLDREHADGVASSGAPGLFGCVQAFFGLVETQGRGGLHPHMHVWVRNPIDARFLDKLRSGEGREGLLEKLRCWRDAVLEKVASIQFDSVEEFGRQLGLDDVDGVPPVPFTKQQQAQTWSAEDRGVLEDDDLGVKPPPNWAPKTLSSEYGPERWAVVEPQGPQRMRPHLLVVQAELDPHQVGCDFRVSRGADDWRLPVGAARLPPEATLRDAGRRDVPDVDFGGFAR